MTYFSLPFVWGLLTALPTYSPPKRTPAVQAMPVSIDLRTEYQTIHSFGASDCWSAKYIGQWTDVAKKNQIADLLFSQDTLASGQPKGIGLSMWRMNIGAGSIEQEERSDITDEWRREECFLSAQGQYNWAKQAGNQWFLEAARARNVPYLLGFTNSPPVHMTVNGKAFAPGGDSLNLKPQQLSAFARFLADVAEHFSLSYISPINEPQWDWKADKTGKASQEGSPARNPDLIRVTRALSQELVSRGASTTIVVPETAQIDYLYDQRKSTRGQQLRALFGADAGALATLPNVAPVASYHSYFSTCDDQKLISTRQQTAQEAQSVGKLSLWQSEFGVLGDICGQFNGFPRHTDIDYGLYVAKVIHHDLTLANVTSWQWWLAINPYNYSDGLVYINDLNDQYTDHQRVRQAGQVVDSKQLWAMGNFSRFVRPGMKRIGVHTAPDLLTQAGSYMLSGYKDEATHKLVLVAINLTSQPVTVPITGVSIRQNQFVTYTTSQQKNLARGLVNARQVVLEPKSITTLVGNYR